MGCFQALAQEVRRAARCDGRRILAAPSAGRGADRQRPSAQADRGRGGRRVHR